MKRNLKQKEWSCWLAVAVLCACLAGCVFPKTRITRAPGAAYGLVSVTYKRDMAHTSSRQEVCYWNASGRRVVVWPYLANQLVYTEDTALFHGYLTTGPSDPGGPRRRSIERLFAVHGAGPAVDLTDEIVRLWSRLSGTNFLQTLKTAGIGSLAKKEGGFEVEVFLWGGGQGKVRLTRNEISELLYASRDKGQLKKDPGFGTPYFKRDLEAELRE